MAVTPQVDTDSPDEWDRLRFGQLIDTCRSLTSGLASFVLGLTLGLVTILGFAVDRESWGLAATALIFEIMIFVVIMRFRHSVARLMDVAATIEGQHCGEPSVTEAHRDLMVPDVPRARLERIVIAVAIIHIAVTVFLALALEWSFAGT